MRLAAVIAALAAGPAAASEDTAQAFWDAFLGCWAVKDGADVAEQGWALRRDWTPECGDCESTVQLWDAGAGLVVMRERTDATSEASCLLSEGSRPRVAQILPELERIWAPAGLSWIADDLKRPEEPFAILLSCEAETQARKVGVMDASGGALRFTVSGWVPDYAEMCEGATG